MDVETGPKRRDLDKNVDTPAKNMDFYFYLNLAQTIVVPLYVELISSSQIVSKFYNKKL